MKLTLARPRLRQPPSQRKRPGGGHAETFISARTGDPIVISCFCPAGEDHLTVAGVPVAPGAASPAVGNSGFSLG